MSYDEHLISEAGGDGDVLGEIEARDKASDPLCKRPCPSEECAAMQDRRHLLALVREQAAKLEAVEDFIGRLEASAEPRGVEEFYAVGKVSARASAEQLRAALTKAEARA